MGVQEFARPLADFNQEQLDQIDANTQAIQTAVNDIKNTDLSLVNDKIGTNTDAAGILTLFAHLVRLYNEVSGVKGLVDTLESGQSSIKGDTSYNATKLNTIDGRIGTPSDSTGGTMFNKINTIDNRSWTNEQSVGSSSDAVGTGSTLFSRIGQVRDLASSADTWAYQAARQWKDTNPFSTGVVTNSGAGFTNWVDVWGSGYFFGATVGDTNQWHCKISIDGGGYVPFHIGAGSTGVIMRFNSHLVIDLYGSPSNQLVAFQYALD